MITIKEEFVGGAKITRAIDLGGWPSLGLWLAMKCYSAENLTDGFVPDEVIDQLRGAPRNARKLLPALVDCGLLQPDGSRKCGLVDQHPNGWQLHDYLHHANSADQEQDRRRKERERKAAYRERAGQAGHVPRDNTRDDGTAVSRVPGSVPQTPRAQAPARADTRARTRAPSPAQPSPTNKDRRRPKDLKPHAREQADLDAADDFSNSTIAERAARIAGDPELSQVLRPHLWPEVVQVCRAFATATGGERRIGNYAQDSGVRALVALLCVFPLEVLVEAVPKAVTSAWWLEKPARPLSHLTVSVLELAISDGAQAAQHDLEVQRAIDLARPPIKTSGDDHEPALAAAEPALAAAQGAR